MNVAWETVALVGKTDQGTGAVAAGIGSRSCGDIGGPAMDAALRGWGCNTGGSPFCKVVSQSFSSFLAPVARAPDNLRLKTHPSRGIIGTMRLLIGLVWL